MRNLLLTSALAAVVATSASAQTEIQWWHAMGAELAERLEQIAADFNAAQSD
jgi:sn-glycerol 3-phosphate transport system substrate-binding protein